jgi:Uncharacterised protein family (UPF0233).
MAQNSKGRDSVITAEGDDKNPFWFKPIMFGLMLIGLVWILTYYISRNWAFPFRHWAPVTSP